jgi:purine-binding chemotaxis protein CheW
MIVKNEAISTSPVQLAVFHVGRYACALSISHVQEINKNLLLTPVHEAPAFVRGIINLRGNVVTVIDLRCKLDLDPIEVGPNTRNVIVKSDRELVGLLVDAVDDIIDVDQTDIRPTPTHLSKDLGEAFEGVVSFNQQLVALLDLERLLSERTNR